MKTILLVGFDSIPAVMAVCGALKPFGAELINVPRGQYSSTLSSLTAHQTDAAPYTGAPLNGAMLVFCGLDEELDPMLAALRSANVSCLKAVLTAHNRSWTPVRLYRELEKEHRAMTRRK